MRNLIFLLLIAIMPVLQGCCNNNTKQIPTGNPEFHYDKPVEDCVNKTFSLTLYADSTAEASVVFYLIDCNDTLMTKSGQRVTFDGITPLDDGYDVVMRVEWLDTIIVRNKHVSGFILTPEPIAPMTSKELEQLINAQDKSLRQASNEHLSQSVTLTIKDALRTPKKLSEVIECISFGEWESVIVDTLGYDENNRITSVTLRPVKEKPLPNDDSDEDDEFAIYDD